MPAYHPARRGQWPAMPELTIAPWTQSERFRDPARRLMFYLGTHRPWWLAQCPVPLCISAHTLANYRGRRRPELTGVPYIIDSGAFTEIRDYGRWRWDEDEYGGMIYRLMEVCGYPPTFVAPLDYPCEPQVVARSGLSVLEHQEWTLESYRYLAREFPAAPWMPVLQGWLPEEYERHDAMYRKAGIKLGALPRVGLGSVCRRGSIRQIGDIAGGFARRGYRLHGFGLKSSALRAYARYFVSADSLAWSQVARVNEMRLAGCRHAGPCNNCPRWAMRWRERVIAAIRASENYVPPGKRKVTADVHSE